MPAILEPDWFVDSSAPKIHRQPQGILRMPDGSVAVLWFNSQLRSAYALDQPSVTNGRREVITHESDEARVCCDD
jgi:hypothetical protein